MHPSAHIVLSGIEACRSYLRQHPGAPVKAVNRRFDYAEAAPEDPATGPHLPSVSAGPAAGPGPRCGRWVELRPHSAGIAIQLVDGPRRTLAGSVLYPATAEAAEAELWLGINPEAITAPAFLTQLTDAADRALRQLPALPEPAHV